MKEITADIKSAVFVSSTRMAVVLAAGLLIVHLML